MNERKIEFYAAPDSEELYHTTEHAAIEELVEELDEIGNDTTVTVVGYARMACEPVPETQKEINAAEWCVENGREDLLGEEDDE